MTTHSGTRKRSSQAITHQRLKEITADLDDYSKKGRWQLLANAHDSASKAARELHDLNYKKLVEVPDAAV